MANPPQHDFRLTVSPSEQGVGCCVTLCHASTGETLVSANVGRLDVRQLKTEYLDRLTSAEDEGGSSGVLKRLGQELAAWLLPSPVYVRLFAALLKEPGSLRLRLDLPSAQLAGVPWEFLYLDLPPPFAGWNGFLSLHPHVSLVRQQADRVASDPLPIGQLRVLVACADPQSPNYPPLPHLQHEVTSVLAALRDSPECRSVEARALTYATPSSLRKELQSWSPHVLHFIGHGDAKLDEDVLVLEGAQPGAAIEVSGKQLAEWLPQTTLRLVVLSACETAGVARTLMRHGIPAVVAMQMPWRDAIAGQFARAFYSALGTPFSIEEALQQARHSVQGAGHDWGVPALYLSGNDSALFQRAADLNAGQTATNLPADERLFVGRRREIADLKRKLKTRGERLVTITGIGGMGKTRISRQAGAELLPEFPDGVWLIECETLTSREDIVAALSAVLRLQSEYRLSEQAVYRALGSRQMLLLFDCFERLVPHAGVIEDLLREAPRVSCLVTSRVVLNVAREYEYPLPPMTSAIEEGKSSSDSVALFAKAASHVVDGFKVTTGNRDTICAICEKLDGIPLRIVLTAGRLRYLSLEELREQLRLSPVNMLRLPGVDRHTSMEQSIAESFLLLPIADQRLLWRLSLFVGGFHYEDAAEVCRVEPVVDVYEGIARLRNHSIVQAQSQGARTRFRILDSVRTYLTIASQGTDLAANVFECQQRHAAHYAAFARRVQESRRQKQEPREASDASLWTEIGNLRAAITFCIETRNHALLVEFAEALARTYFEAGYWSDFETLAHAAAAAAQSLGRRDVQARLLGLSGALAWRRGMDAEAEQIFGRRFALSEALGDIPACIDSLSDLAQIAHENGRTELAKQRLEQATGLAEQKKLPLPGANIRILQAEIALSEARLADAVEHAEQAKAGLGSEPDPDEALHVNLTLGRVYREAGDYPAAEAALLEMLRGGLRADRAFSISRALLELGQLFERRQDLARAAQAYQAAERIHADLPSERRDLTRDALARFKRSKGPEAEEHLQKLRQSPWRKIVTLLLSLPSERQENEYLRTGR